MTMMIAKWLNESTEKVLQNKQNLPLWLMISIFIDTI